MNLFIKDPFVVVCDFVFCGSKVLFVVGFIYVGL